MELKPHWAAEVDAHQPSVQSYLSAPMFHFELLAES